jgi:hypothetical protein
MGDYLAVLSVVLSVSFAVAAEPEHYPWKHGNSFEIYYVEGAESVYFPGEAISLEVQGRALSTHVSPDPEHGFHVQASIDHQDASKSFAGANGDYDPHLRGWRVALEAPQEVKDRYRLRVSLYCGVDESLCADTYGRAAQTTKVFYFDVR